MERYFIKTILAFERTIEALEHIEAEAIFNKEEQVLNNLYVIHTQTYFLLDKITELQQKWKDKRPR